MSLGILTTAAGLALSGASLAEEHDAFCVSCHTAPEQAYVGRAQTAAAGGEVVDLSSAHYTAAAHPFRCIDCHRGNHTAQDRAATIALGLGDTLVWLTGRADPTLEKGHSTRPDLQNPACARCHAETLAEPGFNNHFHNALAAADSGGEIISSVACTDCHRAHVQAVSGREGMFLDIAGVVYPACETCHRELQAGPATLGR